MRARIVGRANPALRTACRQAAGRPGRYLLSGLLKCAQCGANYIVADRYRYACASFLNRGKAVCRNRRRVSRQLLEDTLLLSIRENLFTVEGFAFFRQELRRMMVEQGNQTRIQMNRRQADVRRVDAEIENILRALKAGIWTSTTKSELELLEAEKARLLETQAGPPTSLTIDEVMPRLEQDFLVAVENLAKLQAGRVAEARHGLNLLLGGQPITLNPTDDGGLEAKMSGDYAGVLRLLEKGKVKKFGCGERI